MTEGEHNAHDLTDAIVMLSALNKPRAEISIRRLIARCVTPAQQAAVTRRLSQVQLISKPGQFTPDPHGWAAGRRAPDSASLSPATSALPARGHDA